MSVIILKKKKSLILNEFDMMQINYGFALCCHCYFFKLILLKKPINEKIRAFQKTVFKKIKSFVYNEK